MNKQLPLHNKEHKNEYAWTRNYRTFRNQIDQFPRIAILIFAAVILLLLGWSRLPIDSPYVPFENVSLSGESGYNIDPELWSPRSVRIANVNNNNDDQTAFPASLFTTTALSKNKMKPVTAVLLRVSEDEQDMHTLVHHLLGYPFITEIYIHNLVKSKPLELHALALNITLSSAVNIEIFESDEDLDDMARFTTCSVASNAHCYFQDDLWLHPFMDSAYTNFLQAPNLVHSMAQPRNYADHLRWRFKNEGLNMHAGYAELDTGAFVPRWKVQSFLTQLGKSGMGKSRLRRADRYFSVWTNQYPWILENPLVSLQPVVTNAMMANRANIQQGLYDAMRRMQRVLEDDKSLAPKDYFERFEDVPVPSQRDVRSACANDKCLFTTNMSPFPRPEDIEFTKEFIPNLHHLDALYEDGGFDLPQKHYWNTHSFHMAVDMDPQTCWNTHKSPRAGDYFGLAIVGDITVRQLTVFSSQELKRPDKMFNVFVKENGVKWVECNVSSSRKAPVSRNAVLNLSCPGVTSIKAIKVSFQEDQKEPFELCGLALDRFFV